MHSDRPTELPPGLPSIDGSAHEVIDSVRRELNMSEQELRIAHWSCGGNARVADLSAFLAGRRALPEHEYDTLAAALNDRLIEARSEPSIPYSDDLSAT